MSDEQQAETAKRPPGRPRGAKTKPKPPPPRRHGDDPDRMERYEFRPYEARDKFYISKEQTDAIARDWEQALEWKSLEIMGKPNEFLPSYRANQWEEVRAGDFDGQFDHFGIKDGIICIENVALFRRPIQMQRKAVAWDKRQADAPIIDRRRSHAEVGVENISMPGGASHPSARAQNRYRTTYEPGPKIPE
jgi:hypothetical protein